MTVTLRTPTEAFATVAWLVCGADKRGSTQELQFLYEQVQSLEIFKNCSLVEFQNLLGTAFSKLFQNRANGELSIPQQDVKGAIQAVHEALTPALRVDAFRMAVGLAYADNVCDVEKGLLEQLQAGLNVDATVAEELIGTKE